jgi:serine/threonine-protein kinase RsbW
MSGRSGQDGLEGVCIAVDVAQDEVTHGSGRRAPHDRRQRRESIHDVVDNGIDGQAGHVDPNVGLPVAFHPAKIQALERSAVGRKGTAAIGWNPGDDLRQRQVEPDRCPVEVDERPVFRVGERTAAGRDHNVPHGLQQVEHFPLGAAKVRLAVPRKDVGDGQPLTPLDEFVDVLGPPAQPSRQGPAYRGLAGSHEADQINLVASCNHVKVICYLNARMAFDGHRIRLSLPSSFGLLDLVQALSDKLSTIAGLDEDATHWISVAVRESVINAIKHGNHEDETKRVTVEFTLTPKARPEQLVVEVTDEGEGFDPSTVSNPLEPENVLKSSGRGIFFMRSFMDEVAIERRPGGGMAVRMSKKLAS